MIGYIICYCCITCALTSSTAAAVTAFKSTSAGALLPRPLSAGPAFRRRFLPMLRSQSSIRQVQAVPERCSPELI